MAEATRPFTQGDYDGIERTLLDFVARRVVVDGGAVSAEERLVDTGRVDSLGLLQILAFLDDRYRVDLLAVGSPSDLQSISGLAAAVRRELSARGRMAAEGA
jgi:acyl carrier protein